MPFSCDCPGSAWAQDEYRVGELTRGNDLNAEAEKVIQNSSLSSYEKQLWVAKSKVELGIVLFEENRLDKMKPFKIGKMDNFKLITEQLNFTEYTSPIDF
ncbi:hypothetical protein [Rubinisphaera italica]|uniref:hypothetical protein n=1 Tax=Rubinisphaera italica TaxID=2527969 RepID=UPI0011B45DF8|nr:hypothetical protein [Rubinisphaera italica]